MFRPLVAAGALALGTTVIEAQSSGTVKFQTARPSPAVTAFGYYVGPFYGTLLSDPTRPTIDLFCIDVLNQVTWGQVWNANFTSLASGNFGGTRHGIAAKPNYVKAAWLAEQYRATGIQTSQWSGIQSAMWQLLNPGSPNGGTSILSSSSEAYWLAQVNNWYSNSANVASYNLRRWSVVTATGAAGLRQGGGPQEFLTTGVTPEPETWMLLGTGLVFLVGFAVRSQVI